MYGIRGEGLLRLCLAALALGGAAQSASADTVWQRDWDMQGGIFSNESHAVMDFNYQDMAVDRSGGLLKLESTYKGLTLLHLWPDGSLRWQLSLPVVRRSDRNSLLAQEDGSAVVLQAGVNNHSGHLLRVDPVGRLSWALQVPATRLVESVDELIAIGCIDGSLYLTVVDRAGGTVVRQQRVAQPGCSDIGALHATLSGNDLYIATDESTDLPAAVAKYWRVDAQTGNVFWRVERPGPAARIWLNSGSLYAMNGTLLGALNTANGALRWEKTCGGMAGFVSADPVCASNAGTIQRLAAADGSTVWSASSSLTLLGLQGGCIAAVVRQSGNLRCISGIDGSTQWEIPLQPSNSPPPMLVPSSFSGFLHVYSGAEPAHYVLKRIEVYSGWLHSTTALPQVLRTVSAHGQWLAGGDLYVRAGGAWLAPQQKLRRMSAATGDLAWESVDEIGYYNAEWQRNPGAVAAAESALFLSGTAQGPSQASAQVYALDRDTGRLRWSRSVLEGSRVSQPGLSAVAGGDVISLAGTEVFDGKRMLVKYQARRLSAGSGQDVWSRTLWSGEGVFNGAAPRNVDAGGDLVVAVPNIAVYFPMQRLDEVTGTTVWPAPLAAFMLAKSSADDAVFSLVGAWPDDFSVSRTRAANGQVEWTFPHSAAWASGLHDFNVLQPLPDGDVLVVATGVPRTGGGVDAARTQLIRIKADGSGLRYRWPADADLLAPGQNIKSVVVDSAGRSAWFHAAQAVGGDSWLALAFLVRFDLQQGRPMGSQIYSVTGAHPQFQATAWDPQLMPYGDGFLASGMAARAPLVTTRRDALRDFSVAARGDLVLDIPGLPADFSAGELLPLDVRVNYDGDAAVAGVTVLLDLPWQGTASALTCTGPGVSYCSIDSRYGQIEVRFDAAPGARLRLGGELRALALPAAAQAAVSGVVFGPESLLESDSSNNLRRALPGTVIFGDGFEPAATAR